MGKEENVGECYQNVVNKAGNKEKPDGREGQEPGHLEQGRQTFFKKGHTVTILSFMGHTISVATPQLCPCSGKAAIDNSEMNGYGCVPIKFY